MHGCIYVRILLWSLSITIGPKEKEKPVSVRSNNDKSPLVFTSDTSTMSSTLHKHNSSYFTVKTASMQALAQAQAQGSNVSFLSCLGLCCRLGCKKWKRNAAQA